MRANIFTQAIKKFVFKDIKFTLALLRYHWRYFLATNLLYSFDNRFIKPARINIMLTGKCNLRCEMCSQWGEHSSELHPAQKSGHMDYGLIEKIIKEVAHYRPMIYLWGGEPLLHPDIELILGLIKKYNLDCLINTNGTMLEKNAEILVKNNITAVLISLLGDEGVHDKVTNVKGSYRKVIDGVNTLKAVKAKFGKMKPFIQAHTIITPSNYNITDKLIIQAEEKGFDTIWLQSICFITKNQGESYNNIMEKEFGVKGVSWKGFVLDPVINTDIFIEKINVGLSKLNSTVPIVVPSAHPSNIKKYFLNPEAPIKNQVCSILWNQIDILPNGDVVACHDFQDYITGNVNGSPVLEIFNNEKYKKIRNYIRKKRPFPICSRCVGTLSV